MTAALKREKLSEEKLFKKKVNKQTKNELKHDCVQNKRENKQHGRRKISFFSALE